MLNNYGAFLCGLEQYVPEQQQFAAAAQSCSLLMCVLKYDPERAWRWYPGRPDRAQRLLDVYQHVHPASAESLWLQIRFAALANRPDDVQRYGARLARSFPQSEQY